MFLVVDVEASETETYQDFSDFIDMRIADEDDAATYDYGNYVFIKMEERSLNNWTSEILDKNKTTERIYASVPQEEKSDYDEHSTYHGRP